MDIVNIIAVAPDSVVAQTLMEALDDDLRARYPGMTPNSLRPTDIEDHRLVFLVAYVSGQGVGCGAVRELRSGVGEVKRMFVRPEWRGHGISRQLLSALETHALERGYLTLRLETGPAQPEAIGLYRSAGYAKVPPFGEYVANPLSVCFEKQLTQPLV